MKVKKGAYRAYIETLDHQVILVAGNWPKKDARRLGMEYIQQHPAEFNEFDTLVVAKECERIPVDLVVMGS